MEKEIDIEIINRNVQLNGKDQMTSSSAMHANTHTHCQAIPGLCVNSVTVPLLSSDKAQSRNVGTGLSTDKEALSVTFHMKGTCTSARYQLRR